MKIFLLILSLYLLVLPGLACAETDACTDALENAISQTTEHGGHEDEDCNNFCNCSCCIHIVTVNFQPVVIMIDKPVEKNTITSFYHNISLPSNYFGNIWQPPKMG